MKRIRNVKVTNISQLSPNMKRITFHSKDLIDFPENEDGGYVKLLFKQESSGNTFLRPYTIRSFRKNRLELDIDFSNHIGNQGYATKWASQAKVGDEILISGPGLKKSINDNSDWFFFVGDMTALPAIACYLERIPKSAVGFAVLEIISKDEDNQDKAVLIIKQGLVDHSFVADPEINLASVMIKLARLSNG